MQVQHIFIAGRQIPDLCRQLLAVTAVFVTREDPVQVQPVLRRRPLPGPKGSGVADRENGDPAGDFLRMGAQVFMDQIGGIAAGLLVAVDARRDDDGGTGGAVVITLQFHNRLLSEKRPHSNRNAAPLCYITSCR